VAANRGTPDPQSDESFRLLVEHVQDYAIFMLDPAGNIVTWNQGAERIKGYTADEIIGRHFSVFYRAEDATTGAWERELEAAKTEGRVRSEGWRVRKDGTPFWASVVLTSLWNEDGTLRGFAKITRDSTEIKQAEDNARRLDELRLRQRHALEVNDDIIQGLAVADLALNLEDFEKARQVIAATLEAARRFVTDLLGQADDAIPIAPGDLRKSDRPAHS
jgi:PAS domain S-box-containing protein